MRWTPKAIPNSPYFTIGEDTHFGQWQVTHGLCHDRFLPAEGLKRIEPGSVVIDIGAFNGDHSIAYAQRAGLVWAFEPQLPLFLCLSTNVYLGQHFNVRPERVALGDEEGLLRFADWTGERENFGARTSDASGPDVARLTRLDDHPASSSGRVSYMKLDCEGHEVRVLRGAARLIERDRPAMIVEVNSVALGRAGTSEADLLELLRSYGYDVMPLGGLKFGAPMYDALCVAGVRQ